MSFEVSLASWIIGLVSAIYLWIRNRKNDPILGALIFVYSNMQLAEALMWLDTEGCGAVNKVGTFIAYISLWLHPLAVGYGIYQVYNRVEPLILGFLVALFGMIIMPKMKCSKPGCNRGYLEWGFNPGFYPYVFALAVLMLLVYVRPLSYAAMAISFYIIAFILSLSGPPESIGSRWCILAAIWAPLVAFISYFIKQ
jgi:hypothetical protein